MIGGRHPKARPVRSGETRRARRVRWRDIEDGLAGLRAVAGRLPVGFAAGVLLRIRRDQGEPAVATGVPPHARISTIELEALRHGDVGFLLLDVLARRQFDDDHIGGAQNVPLDAPEFLVAVARVAGGKSRRVVVYGAGTSCGAAGRAAHQLSVAGYSDVAIYDGGLHAWRHRAFVVPSPEPMVATVPPASSAAPGSP